MFSFLASCRRIANKFAADEMTVYAAQASDVCMTMVDGRILYEDGKFLTLDSERVLANARAAVARLYGEGK